MLRKPLTLMAFFLGFCLSLLSGPALAASPSLHEVYQAAEAGKYADAQRMMDQVLKEHPNSAKAHFVEAELKTKMGDLSGARSELKTAESLDPGLGFAKPETVGELKTKLAGSQAMAVSPQNGGNFNGASGLGNQNHAAAGGFPWGLLLVGGALIAAIVFFMRRQRQVTVSYGSPASPAYGQPGYGGNMPYGPTGGMGYGQAPVQGSQPGLGGSILGGLATGAAVGAGVVAGEALMHKVLGDGERHNSASLNPLDGNAAGNHFGPTDNSIISPDVGYDMGGQDFGVSDSGGWDDSGSSGGGSDDWS